MIIIAIQKQLIVFFIIFSMDFYKKLKKSYLFGAHRGYRSIRPENTLAAFEAAMGIFDFIELDVQPSRDGALMILHDDTLERTTDIEYILDDPRPHHLIDYDFETLRALDAGSWFIVQDPSGTIAGGKTKPKEIEPQKIPTLEEALGLCLVYNMPLNIEIKDTSGYDTDKLIGDILKTIAPYKEKIPLLISSFNHRYLEKIHDLDPGLSLAANVEYTHPPDLIPYLFSLGVCGYHIDEPLASTTPVLALEKAGIRCGVFTVNDHLRQQELFNKGFGVIFTDVSPQIYAGDI